MEFLNFRSLSNYYAIPDYQRDYAWTGAENETLLNDIFDEMNHKETPHFIGAIVTVPFDPQNSANIAVVLSDYKGLMQSNIRHVVDGQQRLTSISVFAEAIKEALDGDETLSADDKEDYSDRIKRFLFGDHRNPKIKKQAPRLLLNGNTGKYYNSSILGCTHQDGSQRFSGAKRLAKAKSFFLKEIVKRKNKLIEQGRYQSAVEFYDDLFEVFFEELTFVEIACDSDTNAFQVFESLNGKGLDLTAADRIKNIWMAWANCANCSEKAQKWDSLVAEIGDNYVVNFFVVLFFFEKCERVSKNRLPEEFKSLYASKANTNIEGLINYLKKRASTYGKLRNARTQSVKLDRALKDLQSLGSEQVYVMLFAAANHFGIDLANPTEEFMNFVRAMTNLIVRVQVCDKNLNSLDDLFGSWIKFLKGEVSSNEEGACTDIKELTEKVKAEIRLHLSDDDFRAHFETYAPKDQTISMYYLVKIEEYLRKNNRNERNSFVSTDNLTVEHVIPQTLDSLNAWYGSEEVPSEIEDDRRNLLIERMGNKALLYGDDNTAAGNSFFADKLEVYKNGKRGQDEGKPVDTFELIKDVVDNYTTKFNHDEVNSRAKRLAQIAAVIWGC